MSGVLWMTSDRSYAVCIDLTAEVRVSIGKACGERDHVDLRGSTNQSCAEANNLSSRLWSGCTSTASAVRKGVDMTYDELMQLVYGSTKDDWTFSDERGIYTLKKDLNVRIHRKDIDPDSDRFTGEDWATKHRDPTAYRETYEIHYGASFVKGVMMVSVDGGRATLPLPDPKTLKVTQEDYSFAKIVDQLDNLDDYMERSGLEVEG